MIPLVFSDDNIFTTYSVTESSNSQLVDFLSWDVIWFHHGSVQLEYDVSDSRRRQIYNYDWETIASKAVLAGNVSAACTHAIDQQGYRFFNSGFEIDSYTDENNYPLYNNYKITNSTLAGLGITNDHLLRFIQAYKSRGIKAGFYYNQGQATNLIKNPSPSQTGIDNYYEYLIKELTFLKTAYNPDFIWVDQPYLIALSANQRNNLYQYSKNYNGSLVIHNSFGSLTTQFTFPVDIKGVETQITTPDVGFFNPVTTYSGTDYYIPSFIAYTGLYRINADTSEQLMWNPANQSTGYGDGITYNQVKSQSDFNTYYSESKTNSVPFFLNMPIVQNDLIDDYYTKAKNIEAS